MKRSTGFQVRKRDGRLQWLRATKLARSIGLALAAGLSDEGSREPATDLWAADAWATDDWRAADLTEAILVGLRERDGEGHILDTESMADAAVQVLVATGFPRAAEEYSRAGGVQRRRRGELAQATPSLEHGLPLEGPPGDGELGLFSGRRGSRSARGGRV